MLTSGEIIQCAFDAHSAWTAQLSSHIAQVSLWGGVRLRRRLTTLLLQTETAIEFAVSSLLAILCTKNVQRLLYS